MIALRTSLARYTRRVPARSIDDLSAPAMSSHTALFIRYVRREKSEDSKVSNEAKGERVLRGGRRNRRVLNHSFLYVGVLTTSPPPRPVINSRTAFPGSYITVKGTRSRAR